MSATHTHSATSARSANRADRRPRSSNDYQRFLARRIADGVRRAVEQPGAGPDRLGQRRTEPSQVFNRRWLMKPGTAPEQSLRRAATRCR